MEQEVARLVGEAERLYGMANYSYADYIIGRLEMCISTCSNLLHIIQQNLQLEDDYKVSTRIKRLFKVAAPKMELV